MSVSKDSNTLHHMNQAKHFTENSVMTRLGDILRVKGPADPRNTVYSNNTWSITKLRAELSCNLFVECKVRKYMYVRV